MLFFALAALLTKHGPVSWNDASRFATIDSLVERHSFSLDGSAIQTGDKYRFSGKFYSDKPPVLAIMGAGVALGLKVLSGITLERDLKWGYYLVTLLVVGIAYAGGLAVLYQTLLSMAVTARWSACVVVVAGVGTLLLPYATIFNNHVVSGTLVAVGFAVARRPAARTISYAGAGFTLALAASMDIAFTVFLVLAPILFVPTFKRALPAFIAAAAPIVAMSLAFNVLLSGSLIPPAMNAPLWNYPGSAFDQNNLSGLSVHRSFHQIAVYAVNMLFLNHGVFSYMPILLLSAYGLVVGFRKAPTHRGALVYIAACCSLYVASYIFTSDNYSGWTYGIRWYAGIVYLAVVPLGLIADEIARSLPLRLAFLAATAASVTVATVGLVNLSPIAVNPFVANVQQLIDGSHALPLAATITFIIAATGVVGYLVLVPTGVAGASAQPKFP